MSKRKIEMTWRCSACDTVNKGRHKICQSCGDPKGADERFEMPQDTARAATVTEAALLKLAHAGADWRCGRCDAHNSGARASCSQCGAAREAEAPSTPTSSRPAPLRPDSSFDGELEPEAFQPRAPLPLAVFAAFVVIVLGGWLLKGWLDERPRDVVVAELFWSTTVRVERYAAYPHEGFAESRPEAAIDVVNKGPRHHHDEKILDGYDTEHYTETVPDGTRTETYQEQVVCGQDCVDIPQSCSETCTPDDNGFATCTETCSGGGQSCTPQYCSETRTREVPKTREEPRTRQVPRYRYEPRAADWFVWRLWSWAHHRSVEERGDTLPVRWPDDAAIGLGVGLADGEDERSAREGTFRVGFDDDGERLWLTVPDETTLSAHPLGASRKIRVIDGVVTLVDEDDG
jgi:hypothetical protein